MGGDCYSIPFDNHHYHHTKCCFPCRYEVKDDGKGGLTLVVHKLKLEDEGEYTCKIGQRETTCKLTVDEGRCYIPQTN